MVQICIEIPSSQKSFLLEAIAPELEGLEERLEAAPAGGAALRWCHLRACGDYILQASFGWHLHWNFEFVSVINTG